MSEIGVLQRQLMKTLNTSAKTDEEMQAALHADDKINLDSALSSFSMASEMIAGAVIEKFHLFCSADDVEDSLRKAVEQFFQRNAFPEVRWTAKGFILSGAALDEGNNMMFFYCTLHDNHQIVTLRGTFDSSKLQ